MKEKLIERLVRYAKIDTQSDAGSTSTPTTAGQWDLLHELQKELVNVGLEDITLDDNGYLFATLPSNTDREVPVIGFLAHVDTTTDFSGKNVKPQRIDNYDGKDVQLNDSIIMTVDAFPELKKYVGHTLITTDGTTLLGADDKAGIAEIVTAMEYLIANPDLKHGKIRIAFTPDEEVGLGPQKFDVKKFGAKYAYTMDGGPLGELQYESFNAASVKVTFHGTSVHPGTAKDKMVNSILMANQFQAEMPVDEIPEKTDGYEGFVHLMQFNGSIEETTLCYIIRYFDRETFAARKQLMIETADNLKNKYGQNVVTLEIQDQYFNMGEKIEPVMAIVDIMSDAFKNLNIEPNIVPVRGGTDGSQLSYMGLPTPNIFTGGENYHGKYEYISVDNMVKATNVIIEAVKLFEERA